MTDREKFMRSYGDIYEDSPWVADQLWSSGNFKNLAEDMQAIVDRAGHDKKLALLRAHPDLAGRAAIGGTLTAHSAAEQQGAGLDQCSREEFSEFQHLNAAYREKFGFPFIIAVGGLNRFDILDNFRTRIDNSPGEEFITALDQVHKIARLRLAHIIEE